MCHEQGMALLSVSNKEGLIPFAQKLHRLGYTLLASGGTAQTLRAAHLPVVDVSEVTGFPEILGGRVKTLHPRIHGGILSRRTPEDNEVMARYDIPRIDVVVVNLYPFRSVWETGEVRLEEALELIDIGGVALLRAAAKNYKHVVVVCDPADYEWVADALSMNSLDETQRRKLAAKAFHHTAVYDAMIAAHLERFGETGNGASSLPQELILVLEKAQTLRYGENPHQQAALYTPWGVPVPFRQLHGKEMSYNNWLDLDAAWQAVQEFDSERPAVVIVKHGNPCGAAVADTLCDAYRQALASDSVSAFGSIVAVNQPLDVPTAEAMRELFIEVLVAPEFLPEALTLLQRKSRSLRLVQAGPVDIKVNWRTVVAGWLAQTSDKGDESDHREQWQVVTRRAPTPEEWVGLRFAWRVVKHVKSNAIVLARGTATVGIGAGQMSRVDAVRLAVWKAGDRARGAVLASDAFFPFPDGVEVAAAAGVKAVVQPGGSKRDDEVIATADRLGVAMVFTGTRHFRH